MKILYISDRLNAPDGSAIHGRSFVRNVRASGHQVVTYPAVKCGREAAEKSKKKPEKNLSYYLKKINTQTLKHYLHKSNGYVSETLSFIEESLKSRRDEKNLSQILEKFRPDVMIYRYRLFNFAPFKLSKTYGIPILIEVNSLKSIESGFISSKNKTSVLTRWGEKKALGLATRIFAVSDTIKEIIKSDYGQNKTSVIPNGVDTSLFSPGRYNREYYKNTLGLSGKTVLGYSGSYKNWHGIETCIETIDFLSGKNSNYHLLLVGDGKEFERIKSLIRKKNLTDFVTQTGSVSHDNMPRHIAAFDYALMTYPVIKPFYFSPMKMFEYMSMGIPVVATDIGQPGEVITNGETGILVKNPHYKDFANAIADNENKSHEIGINARSLMINEFSWQHNARRILSICDEMMKQPKRV